MIEGKPKTIIYSTRVDPRIIATLARCYEMKGKSFRTASNLINDALYAYTTLLTEIVEEEFPKAQVKYDTFNDAVGFLVNDRRLDTEQVRKHAGLTKNEPSGRELVKLREKEILDKIQPVSTDDPLVRELQELGKEKKNDKE